MPEEGLEISRNCCEWLQLLDNRHKIAAKYFTWLEVAGNGWKWLEMVGQ